MKVNISKKILLLVIIPCMLIGLVVSIVGANLLSENMTREIEKALRAGAYSMSQTMSCLTLKEEMDKTIEDFYKKTDMDATIFSGNMRVSSSISGAVGTKMDEGIYRDLQSGNDYFATDAIVNGEEYFGYYIPFFVDNEFNGAVFTGIPQAEANAEITQGIIKLIICIVTVMIGAILLSIFIIRQIIKSINDSKGIIGELYNNNLALDYNDKYEKNRDEIEEIYNQAYDFATKLKGIVSGIKGIAQDLTTVSLELKNNSDIANNATTEINFAVESVAKGAEGQAEDTQNVTEMINQMGLNINDIMQDSVKLMEIAGHMLQIKDVTLNDVTEMGEISEKIESDVDEVNTQIDITSEAMEEIKKIVGEIQDIADQTNLLSLNASIEAAHAGEAGKGFSVVATEVGKLAEQSANSASEIEKTINGLLKNFNLIVQKMKVTTDNINQQKEKIEKTNTSFNELDNDIKVASTQIEKIANATDGINNQKDKVIDTICNLSATSEENSAASQEVMAGVEELSAMIVEVADRANVVDNKAKELVNSVSVFKIGD